MIQNETNVHLFSSARVEKQWNWKAGGTIHKSQWADVYYLLWDNDFVLHMSLCLYVGDSATACVALSPT